MRGASTSCTLGAELQARTSHCSWCWKWATSAGEWVSKWKKSVTLCAERHSSTECASPSIAERTDPPRSSTSSFMANGASGFLKRSRTGVPPNMLQLD